MLPKVGRPALGDSVHPSTAQTFQPHSPMGLDLELLNLPLKYAPRVPVALSPERPKVVLRCLQGPIQQL